MAYQCERTGGECDGCGACQPVEHYYCPVCKNEVYESVYVNNNGEVIGCENCAEIKEPHEVFEDETDEW